MHRATGPVLLAFAGLLLAAPAATAQTQFTEDETIVSSDTSLSDEFGQSVALEGDRLVVGMRRFSVGADGAYFFRRVGGSWVEELQVSSPLNGACEYGFTVALEGEYAAVSDPYHDFSGFCSDRGSVGAFRDQGGWTSLGDQLGPALPPALAAQGQGNSAQVYGLSIAMAGNEMVVGADGNAPKIGIFAFPVVVAHTFSGGSWPAGTPFTGSDTAVFDAFGASVALSADGGTLVVGAPNADVDGNTDAGAAYLFRKTGGVWVEERKFTAGDAQPFDSFGAGVAVNADGTAFAVGADFDATPTQGAGSVYIFRESGGVWSQTQNFGAPDPSVNARYGQVLQMDGSRLVVGAPGNAGVYVYRDVGTAYVPVQQLTARSNPFGIGLGTALSLDGDMLAAGTPYSDVVVNNGGAVLLYELPDIALTADTEDVPPGSTLTLTTKGGLPNTPCLVTMTLRGAAPGLGPVVYGATSPPPGSFDNEGRFDLTLPAVPALSGKTVTFRSYGRYQPGTPGVSNEVRVAFQ